MAGLLLALMLASGLPASGSDSGLRMPTFPTGSTW
jgi:hypothetical protein